MIPTLCLVVAGGMLVACGTVLLLVRDLTRVLIGGVLMGNGINLLVLSASGPAGPPPLLYAGNDADGVVDPLPQALVLTAIVITLAMTALLLAMAYRTWQLSGNDEVQDDIEDRRIVLRAEYADERSRLRAELLREWWRAVRGAGRRERLRSVRREHREARRALRVEIRADRRRQARAESDEVLWDDVLGEDE